MKHFVHTFSTKKGRKKEFSLLKKGHYPSIALCQQLYTLKTTTLLLINKLLFHDVRNPHIYQQHKVRKQHIFVRFHNESSPINGLILHQTKTKRFAVNEKEEILPHRVARNHIMRITEERMELLNTIHEMVRIEVDRQIQAIFKERGIPDLNGTNTNIKR